ncbi:MAG: HAD hydrolase family protein [Nitrosopumilus sp.]|nr:HAD hydrolase family protein [Nitrosopumilus sp.]
MNATIRKKCQKINIVLTDVDCVLTDGGMYYTENGDIMKKFHTRDGMGVSLLRKKKISTIIITKEKTKFVKQWAKKMNVEKLYDGIQKKEDLVINICSKYNVTLQELAYIGDDVNDLELLKKVGLSATPADGIDDAKKVCHYICKSKGGEGAFRELADLILETRK